MPKYAQETRKNHERWVKKQKVEKAESEERSRQFDEKMRPFHEQKQRDKEKRQEADTTVDVIDGNTLRHKGVL